MSRRGEIHRKPDALSRMNMSRGQKGKQIPPRTESQKEHIRQIQLSQREIYVEKARAQWQDPEIRDRQVKAIIDGSHIRPNKAEYDLHVLINIACPKEYDYTGDGKIIIGGKSPDFTNINGQKKVIEMFGDFWHSEEVTGKTVDQEVKDRITVFKFYGFDCLIIWEKELRTSSKEDLINKIKEFNRDLNHSHDEVKQEPRLIPKQMSFF